MEVAVDTHDRSGERLPKVARSDAAYETHAFASMDQLADMRVAQIIAANIGEATPSMARRQASGGFEPAGARKTRLRAAVPIL
jgi:hypothetical protein